MDAPINDANIMPGLSSPTFSPQNFRAIMQKQIDTAVDREIDAIQKLSIGNFDGRYIANFPGKTSAMQNLHGNFYHVIGASRIGDLSVIAP